MKTVKFRAEHGDPASWSDVDFDVYWNLAEIEAPAPGNRSGLQGSAHPSRTQPAV